MATNGIDFVIGGKDRAKPAMQSVEKSMANLQRGTDRLKVSTQSLMVAMGPLLALFAAVKAAMVAVGGIKAANDAYDTQTKAVHRLNEALKLRGHQSASDSMQAFAVELQALSGVGDEVTISLMQTALAMGFATDRADDATKAAVGLSAVTGKGLEQSLGDLKSALQGNFEAFELVNPQLRYMASNQDKLNAVLGMATQGLQTQAAGMLTVEGSGSRAASAVGDLMEMVGAILAPLRVLINNGTQRLAENLQKVLTPAVEKANEVMANIGPIVDYMASVAITATNKLIAAFTFVEVVVSNLGDVWEMLKAIAERAMLSIVESVKYALTETIPAYAKWFGENIINLMRDAWQGVIVVFDNAGKILGDLVYQVFEFISSGGQGGVDGLMSRLGEAASRSLTDGFQSNLADLPSIAVRTLTQREQELTDKIGQIGSNLGEEFANKMQNRMIGFGDGIVKEIADIGQTAFDGLDLQVKKNVITQGVTATQGRLLSRGNASSIDQQMLEAIKQSVRFAKRQLELQEDSTESLEDIADNTSEQVRFVRIA